MFSAITNSFGIIATLLLLSFFGSGQALGEDFVKTNGTQFLLNGKSFYFAGTNSYWLPQLISEADVNNTLFSMQAAGIKVLRTWAFSTVLEVPDSKLTYYQLLSPNGTVTFNYGENGLQKLDRIVELAAEYEILLILTLANNWSDYGGVDTYVTALESNATKFHETYFTFQKYIDIYQSYASLIVNRYANSSTIFAWELINEPRCVGSSLPIGSTCNTSTLTTWITKQSEFIKSLDPNHLVTLGDEGFFNWPNSNDYVFDGDGGIDFDTNLAIPSIDFGTFHMYPSSWSENLTFGALWISDHGDSAFKAKKPVVLEEFGYPDPVISGEYYSIWFDQALASNLAGAMYWQWGQCGLNVTDNSTVVSDTGCSPQDGYSLFPETNLTAFLDVLSIADSQNEKSGQKS